MPTTGICLLPPPPGGTSLSAKLIAHLSRRFPEQEHEPFHLEHRLFSDTSSQLPGSDVSKRAFTHILFYSHDSHYAFVSTTKPGNPEDSSSITIPMSSADSFTGLLFAKMQPLWFPRQMLTIDNGVIVHLKNREWSICIGDARVSARSQGAGALRGTIIELSRLEEDESDASDEAYSKEDATEDAEIFLNVLQQIFKGIGETFSNAQFSVDKTLSQTRSEKSSATQLPDWNLAKLYMTVLRGQR